jgi:hypothetical protein
MPINRGANAKQLAPGYLRVVMNAYKERPLEGSKITNKKSPGNRAWVEDFPVAGFGSLIYKPEGASVTYQETIEGSVKRYVFRTDALGYRITHEMKSDNLYGMTGAKLSTALGRSVRNSQEFIMHSILNNATNTAAAYTGWDGQPLLSTAHVLLRAGSTVSNKPTTDVDFGLIPLQAAYEHFHGLVDESGFPIVFLPKMVVHSIGDHWMVNQVLKTPSLPGTNLNDINQIAKEGMSPNLDHYLTDTDAWFVVADNHDMNYFMREAPAFTAGDDFHSGDSLFKVMQRQGAGFGDWRGVYGSTGG